MSIACRRTEKLSAPSEMIELFYPFNFLSGVPRTPFFWKALLVPQATIV